MTIEKYLTHANPSYREFAKIALNSDEPEKYKIIEGEIKYIPDDFTFAERVDICRRELDSLDQDILYCQELFCDQNRLEELPFLPYCRVLFCSENKLKTLPELPEAEYIYAVRNSLETLPDLPRCEELVVSWNNLSSLSYCPNLWALSYNGNFITEDLIGEYIKDGLFPDDLHIYEIPKGL